MRVVYNDQRLRVLSRVIAIALLVAGGSWSQSTGTVAGIVIDQAGKSIMGAAVKVKNAAGTSSGTVLTDAEGRFSVSNLPAGTYSVETSAPGFALNTRREVRVSDQGSPDLSITLNVDSISQSVTVQESMTMAVDMAPQGNTLEATSAKTEISNAVIANFMAPVADFAEVMEQ